MASLADLFLGEPYLLANELLDPQSLTSLASCSKKFAEACDDDRIWSGVLERRWGVQCDKNPRATLAWLETDVRRVMQQSFKREFYLMLCDGRRATACERADRSFSPLRPVRSHVPLEDPGFPDPPESSDGDEGRYWSFSGWEVPARRLLDWLPLEERRKLAAFACHDSVPRRRLDALLRQISLADTPTPELALRNLLLQFPFLPIDAGSGADRVIGLLALNWLRENPQAHINLGLTDDYEPAQRRHTVYSLTYATIMLNTDLHNPAVQPKITADEFVKNCRHVVALRRVPTATLLDLHRSLRERPLAIASQVHRVATFLRSGTGDEGQASPAYSAYSALGGDADVAAATAAAMATHAGGAPVVDWSVAYWNVVDMYRTACANAGRHRWPLLLALLSSVAAVAVSMLSYSAARERQSLGFVLVPRLEQLYHLFQHVG